MIFFFLYNIRLYYLIVFLRYKKLLFQQYMKIHLKFSLLLEETLSRFAVRPPIARVSILPDPHAEIADNAFTAAEFSAAIDGIYTYVLRIHPEIER